MALFSAEANADAKAEFFPLNINLYGFKPALDTDLPTEKLIIPKSKSELPLLSFSLILAIFFLGLFFIKLMKQKSL